MNLFGWKPVHPGYIHFVWLAIAVIALAVVLELRARDALSMFLSPVMQRRLTAQASLTRTLVRLGLVLGCFVCGVWALTQPRARGVTETVPASEASADVMFVLDTSRSMLAEDAAPNRLARAKAEIAQLVGKLEGQRVGLIAFAGRAAPVCPLTPDHSFFNTVLSTVDTRSAGKGGTRVGEAIKAAVRAFPPGDGAKLIVLITDGDDQDPYTQDAAKLARDKGIKIVAVGLGSEQGSNITLTDPKTGAKTTLMYDGKPVISKLDGKALQQLALTTEGAYIPAGTSAVDLDSIMESHVRPIVRAAADRAYREIPAERFPWLVLASLVCFLAALAVGASPDRRGA
ncbi:MAG TPA: VWA domain-containing protein [Kofleriaceae bacterium]|nr:VWA domain-containing protein [Kofleriaceae bacterium]